MDNRGRKICRRCAKRRVNIVKGLCKTCRSLERHTHREKARQKDFHLERAKTIYYGAKTRARKKRLPFDLTVDWIHDKIKQGYCEVTSLPFSHKIQKPPHRFAPSIDKVLPSLGYVKQNCRMVALMVNHIKRDYTDEEVADVGLALARLGDRGVPSKLEESLYFQLVDAGIDEGLVRELKAIEGRKFRVDFAWPSQMLAVEVQGGIWTRGRHIRPVGMVRDMEKFNLLTLDGWRVLLLTSQDVNGGRGLGMIQAALQKSSSSSESPPSE